MASRRDPESGTTRVEKPAGPLRTGIGHGFALVEDFVYLALALLLVARAASLMRTRTALAPERKGSRSDG